MSNTWSDDLPGLKCFRLLSHHKWRNKEAFPDRDCHCKALIPNERPSAPALFHPVLVFISVDLVIWLMTLLSALNRSQCRSEAKSDLPGGSSSSCFSTLTPADFSVKRPSAPTSNPALEARTKRRI